MNNEKLITTLQKAYKREMSGAKIYRELAEHESLKERKEILIRLAEAEEKHAEKWKTRLAELGAELPKNVETITGKIRRWLLIRTGTENAIRRLEQAEDTDTEAYQEESKIFSDRKDIEAIKEVEKEEKGHSKILHSMTEQEHPRSKLDRMLSREKWHTHNAGGWVGQAIYGANDGLGAVFGIVSGMAGYSGGSSVVLVAGLAGSLASALSMGSGAYLSKKSEKEIYLSEIERERAVIISLVIITLAHFAIGVLKTIVTGRGWFKSGLEMTAVGIITAAIAYGVGLLLSPGGHIAF